MNSGSTKMFLLRWCLMAVLKKGQLLRPKTTLEKWNITAQAEEEGRKSKFWN